MPLRHWLQLSLTEGIGPILTARLLEKAGSAEAACAADVGLLQNIEGIGLAKARKIRDALRRAEKDVDAELARAEAAGAKLLCRDDDAYPPALKLIPDPPTVLFVRGDLQPRDLHSIAIVGSRRCSHYGREQAERFGQLLAQTGFTIVSGGARGVDSAAHRGAMGPPNGRTLAVLGSGIDVAYPPENAALFEQIASRGAVISEFPMGSPPMRENFPRRNRIISGIARGVLVIEADVASGALITARQACDSHNRPVFAIPGRIDNAMSAGPHALIRDGAILTAGLDDIIDNLPPLPFQTMVALPTEEVAASEPAAGRFASEAVAVGDAAMFSARQQTILEALNLEPTHLDTLIARTGLPAEIVLQELTMLTLRSVVERVDGQSYVRRSKRR
jgi:DNA processing protein